MTERRTAAIGTELGTTEDAAVFRSIYAGARRFAVFVAPAGLDPDDLVQEALVRVLSRTALASLAEPLGYLRATMLNVVRNEHRRRSREHTALGRLDEPTIADDPTSSVVAADRVARSLGTLAPQTRALVFLVDAEDVPIGEAAKSLGMTPGAARTRLSRARRVLHAALDDAQEGTP